MRPTVIAHVLPKGFVRIRHFGFLANRRRATLLLVVIGHSLGGFLAGYEASHDSGITAVAMISAVNLGKLNADPKEREARLKRWETGGPMR